MSIDETQALLREHKIVPNKVLGQHFMVDFSIYPKLSRYATLTPQDTVLDAGAGFGFFTRFLADKCRAVIAVEKDPQVARVLREQVKGLSNVVVVEGDVLKVEVPAFNKAISFPPYYLSSQLVLWLLDRGFECAVLVVQKEFVQRLLAPAGSGEYGWISVVAFQGAEVELLDEVPKWMFHPEPEVDSVVVRLKPWATPTFSVKDHAFFRRMVKWLFTQRNKKLGNALAPFLRNELKMGKADAENRVSTLSLRGRRVRELAPEDFGVIADELCQ
ncbi:MAG: 16S rRNA (adenine(1518)-N(6)/adenine(1519)-N(6))-dimethyltransferase RsmA [Candidatus Bathyarchaeota archaeon]|nr:16S rRNA (adenine(1518)-N(6)/adenine(1519)-N(6))-dimethyltransferase RsmA [Candidatus Bathyarchaeota archaeon]